MDTAPTYVVQLGPFAWLNVDGKVTTVAAQAAQFDLGQADIKAATLASMAVRLAAVGAINNRWVRYLQTAPVSVVPYEAHAARMAAKAKAEGGKAAPVAEGQAAGATEPAGQPKAPKPTPITTLIREWVAANPQATKADAYAQFPDANRSTVNVQFGAARKGSN